MTDRLRQAEVRFVAPAKEGEFPSDPKERFEAIFAAIGNSEAKCLTLLCLSDNPISGYFLWKKFNDFSENVWVASKGLQGAYCRQSLIPIGLVAEESFFRQGTSNITVGFRLTEAGKVYGLPIAAYLLSKSSDFPHSLHEIFRSTNTNGDARPVVSIARILEFLSENDFSLNVSSIADNLGLDPNSVSRRLRRLSELELVDYESIDYRSANHKSSNHERGSYIRFRSSINGSMDSIKTVRSAATFTKEVAEVLFNEGEVDSESVYLTIKDRYPRRGKHALKAAINQVLSGLARQGVCRRVKFMAKSVLSETRITPHGKFVVREIISPIEQALAGDTSLLDKWRSYDPHAFAKDAVAKHKDKSGNANWKPKDHSLVEVLRVIRENADGLNPSQIVDILGYNPVNFLRELRESGLIHRDKRGQFAVYTASTPQDEG